MCERLNRGGGKQQSGLDFFSPHCLSFYQTVYLIFETTFISACREITDECVEKLKKRERNES